MRGFAANPLRTTGNRTSSAGDKTISGAWIAGRARNDNFLSVAQRLAAEAARAAVFTAVGTDTATAADAADAGSTGTGAALPLEGQGTSATGRCLPIGVVALPSRVAAISSSLGKRPMR